MGYRGKCKKWGGFWILIFEMRGGIIIYHPLKIYFKIPSETFTKQEVKGEGR